MEKTRTKKLIIGITAPGSVNLLRGQLKYFYEQGYKTYLIAPDDPKTQTFCEQENCTLLPVAIEREISLFKDIRSLFVVIKHFRRVKPDIVNAGTPKMGLLAMVAAKLSGVKKRVYTCRGFRYEHEHGVKRKILMTMERISGWCAHQIICISPSLKELGVNDSLFKSEKCIVIKKGSSNGINAEKFNPAFVDKKERNLLRKKLKLSEKFIFGFVGRLNKRKGIVELFNAFDTIYQVDKNTRLLIIGPLEFEKMSDKSLIEKLQNHLGIVMPGRTDDVPLFLSIMDVFVLPTYGEGFGNVFVEAAAMSIPVIGTKVTGAKDAVSNGFNGILVEVKNVQQLAHAMMELKNNDEKRLEMGKNGMEWAKNFDSRKIWEGMENLYLA